MMMMMMCPSTLFSVIMGTGSSVEKFANVYARSVKFGGRVVVV